MAVTKKQIAKTILLPGILPRISELFSLNSGYLAYLIALVYNTVRILPKNHPYLSPDMVGQYGIRQVIAEAANHIVPNRKNIDQIIIFFVVISALIILLIQFILLVVAMIIPKANAAVSMPTKISEFFVTPNPDQDLAYRLLDLVFGIPKFFGSQEETNTYLHKALHSLFEFYSLGMIIVGSMIIIYLVVAVVAETAQSGVPFGQRFNKAWAPIRVVLFFGLLIPVSHGLNGGQYITLASAKLGSSLASTGWVKFNDVIKQENETLTGKKEANVAKPKMADLAHVPAFMMTAKTCQIAYERNNNTESLPDAWKYSKTGETGIQAWIVYRPKKIKGKEQPYTAEKMGKATLPDLAEKAGGNDVHIVFGVKDPSAYYEERAGVAPVCGTTIMKITDVSQPGAAIIQQAYYNLIKILWDGSGGSENTKELAEKSEELRKFANNYVLNNTSVSAPEKILETPEGKKYKQEWVEALQKYMDNEGESDGKNSGIIQRAIKVQIEQGTWGMDPKMRDYGWAGAGIWYNKIAEQNGALVSAIRNTPVVMLYPRVMEFNKQKKEQEDKNPSDKEKFAGYFSPGSPQPEHELKGEIEISRVLNQVHRFWNDNPYNPDVKLTENPIIDTINAILGTQGLFEICENTDIHPLAQLSAVGKSMLDSSIASFAAAGIFGIASIIPNPLSGTASAMTSFFGTVGSVGLLVGFVLFYVLPFLPFIYFFFAVGGWIKGIFEAMVAMPLWALAHLRIDGEGIPGDAAIGGYFLIFEIFIRPILIVFGLLAAITIFAAMINVLNEVFYLLLANLSGNDPKSSSTECFKAPTPTDVGSTGARGVAMAEQRAAAAAQLKEVYRGPVDEFFFTILYTIIVYMIGTASFKLIDTIPNNILRWFNAEVPSFNDKSGDAAEGLMTYIVLGGSQFGQQLGDSVGGLGSGLKETAANFGK